MFNDESAVETQKCLILGTHILEMKGGTSKIILEINNRWFPCACFACLGIQNLAFILQEDGVIRVLNLSICINNNPLGA